MVKIRFCPNCKSTDVQINISTMAVFGFPQKWICNKCGFKQFAFPEMEVDEDGNVIKKEGVEGN